MSLTGISANRLELLQIAEAVAREKSIDKEIVIEAIEEAIQKGARSRYGAEHDIRKDLSVGASLKSWRLNESGTSADDYTTQGAEVWLTYRF